MSKKTRVVDVGGVKIGGENPVVVQSMTNTSTSDLEATLDQIEELVEVGCELVRVAVPDMEAAEAVSAVVEESPVPLVADIHYDPRLALESLKNGADKLRLNPGNITDPSKIEEIAAAALDLSVPIRVGVNSGSLSSEILKRYGGPSAEAMVASAEKEIELLENQGFSDVVVSLKSSDVPTMIEANEIFSEKYDYPLHLGVTEAGGGNRGVVKSSLGIGNLLARGIGDTVRVSLTGHPSEEVTVAYQMLDSLGIRNRGVKLISCPTCGRTEIPVEKIFGRLEEDLADIDENFRVSVMGCSVNGIGEAEESDLGLVGTPKGAVLYEDGRKSDTFLTKESFELKEKLEKRLRDKINGES